MPLCGQQPYTASFIAKMGDDTVIVETYNMLPNHLFGKAYRRYPEDEIGVFHFHFYPDGSIKNYTVTYMKPDSSFVTSSGGVEGVSFANDTCTYFGSWPGEEGEYINKYALKHIDFIGGWTPFLSLIEWNCMRLKKSGGESLPLNLINDYIGTREVAVFMGNKDTMIFGGPFLEYTKLKVSPEGRILAYDGTSTPWNFIVTKHAPINVDEEAKRMSKKPKIGIPSPNVNGKFFIANDTIAITYGSPHKRGRQIFGGVVPYDSVWRTGANDPTKITLPYAIQFGKVTIPKGEYAVYTIPRPNAWTLIFNSDLKRWPTDPDRGKDIALIPMQVRKPVKPADQLIIDIEPAKDGGIIKITWDETEAFAPFRKVKK